MRRGRPRYGEDFSSLRCNFNSCFYSLFYLSDSTFATSFRTTIFSAGSTQSTRTNEMTSIPTGIIKPSDFFVHTQFSLFENDSAVENLSLGFFIEEVSTVAPPAATAPTAD